MQLRVLAATLSVMKLNTLTDDSFTQGLYFLSKTDEELSLVCESRYAPSVYAVCEDDWRAFRVEGVLDFSLTGILARISGVLADAKIGIFAVSTYNTDYILVKAPMLEASLCALKNAGYQVNI